MQGKALEGTINNGHFYVSIKTFNRGNKEKGGKKVSLLDASRGV